MKKSIVLSIVISILCLTQTSFAQNRKKQARSNVDFRVGLVPTFAKDDGNVKLLPLSLNYDYRIAEKITVGAYVGYSVTETDRQIINDGVVAQWRNQFSIFGLRVAAHANKFENWDIYGGFMVGYNLSRVETLAGDIDEITKHMGIKPVSGRTTLTGFVGGRYDISKKVGITGEIGFGVSIINLGASYKF